MNKIKFFLLLSFTSLFFLLACGKKDSPNGPEQLSNNYFPYHVGNSWTYQVSPTTNEAPYNSTLEVIDEVTINGVDMVVVKEESTKSPEDFNLTYYQMLDNSLLMHKIEDYDSVTEDTTAFTFVPPATWLKFPFVKDDTWPVFTYKGDPTQIPLVGSGLGLDSTYAGLEVDLTLSGKTIGQEKVSAAGKEFDAFKVDFNFIATITLSGVPIQLPGTLGSFWVVPEVGIVRIAFYNLDGDITELRTMTSYKVN